MLKFSVDLRILDSRDVKVNFNHYGFGVFDAEAGNVILPILIDERCTADVGEYIRGQEVYLTHFELDGVRTLGLRVAQYENITEDEYVRPQYLDVLTFGMCKRSKRAVLQKVGVRAVDFFRVGFSLRNEVNERLELTLVAFREEAHELDSLEFPCLLEVRASLAPSKKNEGFELNLREILRCKNVASSNNR